LKREADTAVLFLGAAGGGSIQYIIIWFGWFGCVCGIDDIFSITAIVTFTAIVLLSANYLSVILFIELFGCFW
jgi:hypothetical protein